MLRAKPLPASLRPRKRYIAFRAESDRRLTRREVGSAIAASALSLFGETGLSEMNLRLLEFREDEQRGFVVCAHTQVLRAVAAMSAVSEIAGERVHLRPLGVSGTVRALRRKFLSGEAALISSEKRVKLEGKDFILRGTISGLCYAEPVDEVLRERLRILKLRFVGALDKELRGEEDAADAKHGL